ncbi:MAG: hypothetical protein Q7S33_05840 [Nanoarchaeota archaeon]|nr:hypothetical protein [Nanoarchaeota archaeon]
MNKIILPDTIFGVNTREAYDKIMSEDYTKPIAKPIINPNVQPQDGFIYVPSINLYVAKERTLHGKSWDDCHEQLQNNGERMPTIPEFWSFVDYLKTNYQNKTEAQTILEDIFKIGIWRGEYLDAQFEKKGLIKKEFFINSMHELKNGKLIPKYTEKLEDCLMEDCYADLNSINKQGLFTIKSSSQNYVQGSNVYFWYPRDERVSWFYANSDWADLYCYRGRSVTISELGVRACREATAGKI